jgi:hypothetical protein
MHAHEMIATHPRANGAAHDALIHCIEECYDCSQVCTSCADACLGEEMVADLVACIRTCLDCADVCVAMGQIGTRLTDTNDHLVSAMLTASAEACQACAEACERHADHHEHCRICAEACRRCNSACHDALTELSAVRH